MPFLFMVVMRAFFQPYQMAVAEMVYVFTDDVKLYELLLPCELTGD